MRYSLDEADDEDDDDDVGFDTATPHRSLRSTDASGRKLGKKDRTSLELKVAASKAGQTPSPTNSGVVPSRAHLPTPLRLNLGPVEEDENDNSLVLQHSDDEDERDSPRSPLTPMRSSTAHHPSHAHHHSADGSTSTSTSTTTPSTAEKAGIILGIHNVYIVLPQFIVTAMSSIIFRIMEPPADAGIVDNHPLVPATGPETIAAELAGGIEEQGLSDGDVAGEFLGNLIKRAEGALEGGSSDAVGLIFR
jgi:solute carrier family 45 protein 1/2/4